MDYGKLKGNLGLKSSALAPTACKLSTQFLVLDHMSNHYMKIAKAKSAIDSRPPKSLVKSQKMRDRKSRNRGANSSCPHSISSTPHVDIYEYEDILKDEPDNEEERLVHSIMRSTLLDGSNSFINTINKSPSHLDMYDRQAHSVQHLQHSVGDSHYTSPYATSLHSRPASARSAKSGHSLASSPSHVTDSANKRACKGDVLERRPHLFTEPERPFTPRTLKFNSESRLKHSKCYNPPRSKGAPYREKKPEKDTPESQKNEPQIKPRKNTKPKNSSDSNKQDAMKTAELSESMLMDISLRSQDERYIQQKNHDVPPLGISVDKDHMNWLQEQASKAEARVRSSGRLKSSLYTEEELHLSSKHHQPVESAIDENVKKEKLRKDEEQKYLTFAKEVTDDVLSRGICSDSVLMRVFENHVERRKHDLDEGHMRKVIKDLHKNLGLKEAPEQQAETTTLDNNSYNSWVERGYSTLSNGDQNGTGYNRITSNKSETTAEGSQNFSHGHEMESTDVHSHHSKMSSTSESSSNRKYGQNKGTFNSMDTTDVHSHHSKISSTTEPSSSIKYDQKGDTFSTSSSMGTAEVEDNEMKRQVDETQSLKQYTRSMKVSSESSNVSNNANKPETKGAISTTETSKLERPATGERRQLEDVQFRSDNIGHGSQKVGSTKDSRRVLQSEAIQATPTASSDQEFGNRVSRSDRPATEAADHPASVTSHHSPQDNEDISSSSSQHQPVKPRPRARQRRHQPDQWQTSTAEVDKHQQGVVHRNGAESHQSITSPIDDSQSMTADVSGDTTGLTDKSVSYQNHHRQQQQQQQSDEEGDEYEEDYEEIIESEDDEHGDTTHRTSDDDF